MYPKVGGYMIQPRNTKQQRKERRGGDGDEMMDGVGVASHRRSMASAALEKKLAPT